jgi:hypothetical protein
VGVGVEVVIPSLRQAEVERLVASLLLCEPAPDIVTIVSNETDGFAVRGGSMVRLLRFKSDEYCIGEYDVALRQNVGIWAAYGDVIIIQGDDQVAPPSMVKDSLDALEGREYVWGNHRLCNFDGMSLEDIRLKERSSGLSREDPEPPSRHGYQSCYGGMFVCRTPLLREVGGFDMAFNCRHANEDQQLGYRLMRMAGHTRVDISDPPFSWHDIALKSNTDRRSTRDTWLEPKRNGCRPEDHDYYSGDIGGQPFMLCYLCAYSAFVGDTGALFRDEPLIRYRPEAVQTSSVWL